MLNKKICVNKHKANQTVLHACGSSGALYVKCLTLLQSCSQQHGGLRQVLWVRLDEQPRFRRRSVRPPTQSGERCVDLQLLLQTGAYLLVPAHQALWYKSSSGPQTQEPENIQACREKKNKQMTSQVSRYLATCGSSEFEPRQLVSPLQTRLCTPLLPPDSWAENTVTKCCTVYKWWNVMFSISELLYTLIHKTQTYTYLSTASLMSLIQVFRSSLDDVWTSYISGPAADALIKNIPLSSFATSRTISFCRAMTGGFWSWRTLKVQRISSLQDKIEKVIECRTVTETQQTAVLEPGYLCGN